jgi:hypothetical protein
MNHKRYNSQSVTLDISVQFAKLFEPVFSRLELWEKIILGPSVEIVGPFGERLEDLDPLDNLGVLAFRPYTLLSLLDDGGLGHRLYRQFDDAKMPRHRNSGCALDIRSA